jgi:translation initiation factor 1A
LKIFSSSSAWSLSPRDSRRPAAPADPCSAPAPSLLRAHPPVRSKGKGGKNRRRGKNEGEEKRELVQKEDGQDYGKVLRMLGNGRLEAYCFEDGQTRQCHIRGKMRKKVWVSAGDIVLVSMREFQDGKGDVILKYAPDEARSLKTLGQLPDSVVINDTADGEEEEGGVEFVEDDDDEGGEVE